MQIQSGLKRGTIHRKYALGAHPIIQVFMDKLGMADIIGSHIKQDLRLKLTCEKTIALVVHNILTTPLPLYEFQDWLNPKLDLAFRSSKKLFLHLHFTKTRLKLVSLL